MIVTCEACTTRFNLNDELVKPSGSRVRCSKCQKVFRVYLPIAEEPALALPTETSDINLEFSSAPPLFEFTQLKEHEDQKTTLPDLSVEAPSLSKEYLDMTEYDFTEIDKMIQADKLEKSEPDRSESDLLILPGDLAPEPSFLGIETPKAQTPSEELDKLLEIDLSSLSLDQPEHRDRLDDTDPDLKTLLSDQSFENELAGMHLALDAKTESTESKPPEVSLDDFEKSLEMNFTDFSLTSPADEEIASDQQMDIAETEIDEGQKAEHDLFSEDELGGFDDIDDLDLSDIETLLKEQDAGGLTTSFADDAETFKRSDSLLVSAPSDTETDTTLDIDDQFLTFDELQLDQE
ncbi:MAG: zinc-ribbon domain-containing protein [Deltaproteobacteria bacterium]|nr:zinc-ribbon domain-containing protein [Deltaproteobacteria bacterium]